VLAKISVFLIQHHTIKAHKATEVYLHAFLTLVPERALAVLPMGNKPLVYFMGSSDTDKMVEKGRINCNKTIL
jgi:hypothetical protein